MKKAIFALLSVCILFCSLAGCGIENVDQYEPTGYTAPAEILFHGYAITDLNIYTQPDENSKICGKLSLGDYFHIEQIQGNWCKISDGWIPLEGVSYREIDKAWPAIMEGYVKPQKTTIWKKPNSNASSTATYYNGDSVLICLVAGQWGLTKDGWVYMDHINITKTYDEDDYQTNKPDNQNPEIENSEATVPQQTENSEPTQDKSHLLKGTWYNYFPSGNGTYYINSIAFYDGYMSEATDEYSPETGKLVGVDGSECEYTFDGKTLVTWNSVYAPGVYNQSQIRISGNRLYWGSQTDPFHRLSWEELKAQIDKEYNGTGTIDTAIVGSWYRYIHHDGQDKCYVIVKNFTSSGVCSEKTYTYMPSNPDSFYCSNSLEYGYTFEYNGSIIYNRYDSPSYEYAEVIGNTLKLSESDGVNTYCSGTAEDGLAALKAYLKEHNVPVPPTEPETEPTEAVTEATTEPSVNEETQP